MAQIWEYIATYNPQGFYEDNRSKMLQNDINAERLGAYNRENKMENLVLGLKQRLANGDQSALKELGIYSPETTKKYLENENDMLEYARPLAQAYMQAAPENRARVYGQIYNRLKDVMDVSDMPAQWDNRVDGIMEVIANSDPQKLRDERIAEIQAQRDARLNEYTKERDTIQHGRDLEKLQVTHDLNEDSAENQYNRDIRKLQYAYDKADADKQKAADFLSAAFQKGKISESDYISALGKTLGAEISTKSAVEKLDEDFMLGKMSPEQEQDYISKLYTLTRAKNTKTARTVEQNLADKSKGLYSLSKSDLPAEQKAALWKRETGEDVDFSKPNQLVQDIDSLVDANEREGWGLSNDDIFSIAAKRDTIGKQKEVNADKHQKKLEEIDLQNQGRLDVVDKQGQNALNLENAKEQNRVALKFIEDKISEGKELRQLDNDKSLAEFKNSLPTEERLQRLALARELLPTYPEGTTEKQVYDNLLATEHKNALKIAEIDRQQKQAQLEKTQADTQKVIAELPFAGQTPEQKNAQWLVDQGAAKDVGEAMGMLKPNKHVMGRAGDVINGVTLTGYPAYDEALLKKKAEEDAENTKNKDFIKKQAARLKPTLEAAYNAAKNGKGIGYISGRAYKYVMSDKQASKNISAITTLMNQAGPTMIAQLKAAGAGARSFDSEGERQTYLPDFSIYQNSDVLANTIKEFADKMLDIKLEDK